MATHDRVFKELNPLLELIESIDGRGGVYKGAIPYNPDGEGLETYPDFEDRVRNFSLLTRPSLLHVLGVSSSPTHEKPTNEVWLTMNRNDTAARYIVSHSVAMTAREGVKGSSDRILDDFTEYLPIFRR